MTGKYTNLSKYVIINYLRNCYFCIDTNVTYVRMKFMTSLRDDYSCSKWLKMLFSVRIKYKMMMMMVMKKSLTVIKYLQIQSLAKKNRAKKKIAIKRLNPSLANLRRKWFFCQIEISSQMFLQPLELSKMTPQFHLLSINKAFKL